MTEVCQPRDRAMQPPSNSPNNGSSLFPMGDEQEERLAQRPSAAEPQPKKPHCNPDRHELTADSVRRLRRELSLLTTDYALTRIEEFLIIREIRVIRG